MAKHDERRTRAAEDGIRARSRDARLRSRTVLKAFAQVREFRALGAKSHPMCRALTKALIGETTTWQQWASRSCSRPTGRRRDHDRQERHAAGLGNRADLRAERP